MPIKQDLKDAVKITRRTFFYPSAWLGLGMFTAQTEATIGFVRRLFEPSEPKRAESFSDAMTRLGLNEEKIRQIRIRYNFFVIFFIILGFGLFGYGLYLLRQWMIAGFFLAMAAAGLAWVNAFRFHFYLFQIRHRKLGCTFKEWLSGRVSSGDGNNA